MATTLFWMAVIWLGYVYLGYPLALKALALVRRVRPQAREEAYPAVSVLLAARNEEQDIAWKVRETLAWDYPAGKLELLVLSDASEDRTDEILRGFNDPRLKAIRVEQRGGKGAALNRLAQLARGEVFFFTDANTHIPAGCLKRMVRHFADQRVGCVTGRTSGEAVEDAEVGSGGRLYLGYETTISQMESRLGSVLVCDGAIFCIRGALFHPLNPDLANDLELPMRIGRAGYWVLHEPGAVAFEKDTSSAWESFKQRRRISAQGMLAMWKLRGTLRGLRGWQFISRKFLRWLTIIPLLLALVAAAALRGRFFQTILLLQVVFYLGVLLGLMLSLRKHDSGGVLSVPFYVVLSSLATLVGVIDACLGKRFAVWEIPTLSRGGYGTTWQKIG